MDLSLKRIRLAFSDKKGRLWRLKGRSMSFNPEWLDAIHDPATYPHPVSVIELLETHISWVILTGDWAYKLKRPVNFGFVDFSSLELRHAACHEEIRLNRRTAPSLYDDVVPLATDVDGPQFGGSGAVIEYAVRMKQFRQEDLLENCLARGELSSEMIDELAGEVAGLHSGAAVATLESPFGESALIRDSVQACFDPLMQIPLTEELRFELESVSEWFESEGSRLQETFVARKRQGWVRECHGDLHLGNLVLYRQKPTLFDCLEFNPQLRWIDVISDIAFLVMDLFDRGAATLASRLLNSWLERTGDYEGLKVLKYYLAYRALVRAKVAALRFQQLDNLSIEATHQLELLKSYVDLGRILVAKNPVSIVLMHGVSGSGKSFVASQLATALHGIRIRSDVERKRLWGRQSPSDQTSNSERDLYSQDVTHMTYERLKTLVRSTIDAGYITIVDATFLKRADRIAFAALAHELDVPCVTVACHANECVLRERLAERGAGGGDASDADVSVLRRQLVGIEPLDMDELMSAVVLDTANFDLHSLIHEIQQRIWSRN